MGNTSFGGRARCDWRSVPGNVGVGTSPSAGPRALQPGGQRARMAPRRAPWVRKLLGSARPAFPAQNGPAGAVGAARLLGLPLRGPSGAAPGIWRPQLELLRLPARGSAAAPSRFR
eukprot:scaffold4596_cov109-Isochrysis_galbana.AAC.5